MGKKDKKKKDPEKKAALQAAKQAKADKAALKRLNKERQKDGQGGGGGDDDDFDALLASCRPPASSSSSAAAGENAPPPSLVECDRPPSARANFSLTVVGDELLLFGGERFDGVENVAYDELYRYDVRKGAWRVVVGGARRPPPRCAHSAVVLDDGGLHVFGGELATATRFHHHRDHWRYDLATHEWTELRSSTPPPSPRSGHRCVAWRNRIVLFGGFREALRESPRWFDQVWIFDARDGTWTEHRPTSNLSSRPDARSAFSFGARGDVAYVVGGFSKLRSSAGRADETRVHADVWALDLRRTTATDDAPPAWRRVKRKGAYPAPPRSGASGVVHGRRLLTFGGAHDEETEGHTVRSVFYDDLHAFDMERESWYPIGLKKVKEGGGRRRKRKEEDEGEGDDDVVEEQEEQDDDDDEESQEEDDDDVAPSEGWNLDKLKSNMFAYIDGDGNVVYEKIEEDEDEEKKETETRTADGDAVKPNKPSTTEPAVETVAGETSEQNVPETKNDEDAEGDDEAVPREETRRATDAPDDDVETPPPAAAPSPRAADATAPTPAVAPLETPTPLPRINAGLAVHKNTLYLLGGLLEVGNREVTLDDFWTLDLNKREAWVCLSRGTMHEHVWRDKDDDDDTSSRASGADHDDDEDDDEDDDDDGVVEPRRAGSTPLVSVREEVTALREEYGLDDDRRTPLLGGGGGGGGAPESVADFYARTSAHWETECDAGPDATPKERKREAFASARARYEELAPVLERLAELETESPSNEDDDNNNNNGKGGKSKPKKEDGATTEKKKKKKKKSKDDKPKKDR